MASGLDFVEVGQSWSFSKTIGEVDVYLFAGITGDFSDSHLNAEYMKKKTAAGKRITHGALLVGFMSTVSTHSIAHIIHKEGLTDFPVSSGYDRVRFLKPVILGDTITAKYTISSIDKERGRSIAKNEIFNQDGELVAVADHIMRWADKLSSAETKEAK